MFILISYDITDNRRRTKICKTLKNYGERVQYSVFECLLDDENLLRLKSRLKRLMKDDEDKVRIYQLCETCKGKIIVYGRGKVTEEEEVYVV